MAVHHDSPRPRPLSPRRRPVEVFDLAPAAPEFLREALEGLRRTPKELPCKYFYDERGSQLFDRICELDEYYPTRTELGILQAHAAEMAAALGTNCLLVEYGSGSSLKTRLLLKHLAEPVAYMPVDISREHLAKSAARLAERFPALDVRPVCADFTAPMRLPPTVRPAMRKAVYFPGSTIGNFAPDEALNLLKGIAQLGGPGGGLLIGVDLKKDRAILEPAYNDSLGVTAAFNKNLLVRMNRELGCDFAVERFRHHACYNDRLGRVEMHLVSEADQVVRVGGERVRFARGEGVHTENSYKWAIDEFAALAGAAGLRVDQVCLIAWRRRPHIADSSSITRPSGTSRFGIARARPSRSGWRTPASPITASTHRAQFAARQPRKS
jgi:L-histidine Nalpha-methyltransferase